MEKKEDLLKWAPELTIEAINFTQNIIMLKLISTIDDRGWPHITFIASNKAISKKQLVWGQFFEGTSKSNVHRNPKQGLLYMSAETPLKILQIKANFSHTKTEGEDLDYFNNSDSMRFQTLMNVWRVFYNDVTSVSPIRKMALGHILKGILLSKIGKGGAKSNTSETRLDNFGVLIFKGAMNPKFISYIDPSDGYPIIIPCMQLTAADGTRLAFTTSLFKDDLNLIPINSKVAVFGMTMELLTQTVKGTFTGFKKFRGIKFGIIEIEEVYNGCPPLPGIIYPKCQEVLEITNFEIIK